MVRGGAERRTPQAHYGCNLVLIGDAENSSHDRFTRFYTEDALITNFRNSSGKITDHALRHRPPRGRSVSVILASPRAPAGLQELIWVELPAWRR